MNECISSPCENGAGCTDSSLGGWDGRPVAADAFSCACLPGWSNGLCAYDFTSEYTSACNVTEGGACDEDLDECLSNPCVNGGGCSDSTVNSSVPINAFSCACAAGYSHGFCAYTFSESLPIRQECSVMYGGTCDLDVDECASSPCVNGAVCSDSTTNSSISIDAYRCDCLAGFSNGACTYDFLAEFDAECRVMESSDGEATGNCDIDVDECVSNPCQNGAACTDSSVDPSIPWNAYKCACVAGFANGACDYDFIRAYTDECNIQIGGNCDLDVDECASSPCQNGATCTESTVESTVSFHAYQCTCVAGFANGVCSYSFISEYDAECDVQESNGPDGNGLMTSHLEDVPRPAGNCDLDVDECDSSPCQNGATCSQSSSLYYIRTSQYLVSEISFDAYRCSCAPGFANGGCEYDFISEYSAECSISESTQSSTLSGNCDLDVDECASAPCMNGAACADSTADDTISFHAYQCTCVDGFANGVCGYDFIAEYTDECSVAESAASDSLRGNCDIDVDECSSGPCQNGATCTESYSELGLERRDAFTKISVIQVSTGWTNDEIVYTTYNLAVSLAEGAMNLHTIFGDEQSPLVTPPAYQSPDGVDIGGVAVGDESESATYDSWLTVGLVHGSQYEQFDEIQTSGIDYSSWETVGLMVTNGSVAWNAPDHAPRGDHIVVAQLTVEAGQIFNATMNLRGQSLDASDGDWTEREVLFSNQGPSPVSFHAYQCTCVAGFANGVCEYDGDARERTDPPYGFIVEYASECDVQESTASLALSGNCDIDVNECDSSPCQNGATCTESTSEPRCLSTHTSAHVWPASRTVCASTTS